MILFGNYFLNCFKRKSKIVKFSTCIKKWKVLQCNRKMYPVYMFNLGRFGELYFCQILDQNLDEKSEDLLWMKLV